MNRAAEAPAGARVKVASGPLLGPAEAERFLRAELRSYLNETGRRAEAVAPLALTTRMDEDLALDSLARLSLIARLVRTFDLSRSGVEDYLLVSPTLGDWADLIARHFEIVAGDAKVLFHTSGSTGIPVPVAHAAAWLQTEASALAAVFGRPKRVVALVPPQHLYGFMATVMLPLHLGCPVVELLGRAPSVLERIARPGDLIVATPFLWDLAVESGVRLPEECVGVTSGAPASASLWDQCAGMGLAALTEIYGATETGGVGWRDSGLAAFRLLSHLRSLSGAAIGRGDGSRLAVQDRLIWESKTTFRVAGRLDGAVQVGGVNVWPDRVRARLCAVEGVSDAAVRLRDGRLHAFVVLRDASCGTDCTLDKALRAAMAGEAAPARPVSFTFGSSLPRNAMGKLVDWV